MKDHAGVLTFVIAAMTAAGQFLAAVVELQQLQPDERTALVSICGAVGLAAIAWWLASTPPTRSTLTISVAAATAVAIITVGFLCFVAEYHNVVIDAKETLSGGSVGVRASRMAVTTTIDLVPLEEGHTTTSAGQTRIAPSPENGTSTAPSLVPRDPVQIVSINTHDEEPGASVDIEQNGGHEFVLKDFHRPQHVTICYRLAPGAKHPKVLRRSDSPSASFALTRELRRHRIIYGIIGGFVWLVALVFLYFLYVRALRSRRRPIGPTPALSKTAPAKKA